MVPFVLGLLYITCCGKLFLESPPPLLPADVSDMLNARDKNLRRADFQQGHTHVISRIPAKMGSSKSTKGIPLNLLPQISANGVRRRLTSKTPSVVANLRFFERNIVFRTEQSVSRRLTKKSTVVVITGPEDNAVSFPASRRVKARTVELDA